MNFNSRQFDFMNDLMFQLDKSGNGLIDLKELKDALDGVGYKIPQWKVGLLSIILIYNFSQ